MIYCLKKNSASISRVLYPRGVSIINLEQRITTHFYCFLPSSLREQRSCTGILGIAAHRMLVSLPLCRLLVSFAGTKHCCLTVVNRDGALCCPDFPRDRGLKLYAFLPLSRDRPIHYFLFASLTLCVLCAQCRKRQSLRPCCRTRRAAYGNRTRLLGLGSRCTTDVLMPQICCKVTTKNAHYQILSEKSDERICIDGIDFASRSCG